jgi:orotate phosphoribosyltransferase
MIVPMPDDDLSSLARDIDARCRLRGTFTLRSGQISDEYFDKYLFESDPGLLRRVTDALVPLVPAETELLGGLELGGIPLVTLLSQTMGLPALFVRKAAKEYGTRRLAEGGDPAGGVVTLVEDVITTGGAVVNAAHALRSLGATVTTVVCAIDRSPSGGGELGPEGIMVRSVLTKALLDSVRAGLQCPRSRQTGRHASTYAARCSPVRVERASTRSAGVPSKTTRPPSWPAPGPKSIIQSACAITA